MAKPEELGAFQSKVVDEQDHGGCGGCGEWTSTTTTTFCFNLLDAANDIVVVFVAIAVATATAVAGDVASTVVAVGFPV